MKKTVYLLLLGTLIMTSCSQRETDLYDENAIDQRTINSNADKFFSGKIDPKQDWCPITYNKISIKADANLSDIVKVQILTESPYFNEDARVLNETEAKNGQTVTLSYDAPNIYKQLVAACVNSKGVYYIQVFNVGDSQVSFASANSRVTRATASEVPSLSGIKLGAPYKSLNALRTLQGDVCIIKNDKNKEVEYTVWANSGWKDEQMWEVSNGTLDGGWKIDEGTIYRDINGFDGDEQTVVAKIISDFLVKEGSDPGSINSSKRNNLKLIRNSSYFKLNQNYLYTDGTTPVTLIPIQANSTEFKLNNIYYYYYKPEDVVGDEVDYIKSLPKFKAIPIMQVQATVDIGKVFRNKEFLLPFYGDGTPAQGASPVSAVFPKGYKIGFLNMKHPKGNFNIAECKSGCTYGDGRLNYEVNHIQGHFNSAIDKEKGGGTVAGMDYTDPRIAIFTANDKTYMCFEDGADCTFCDMIVEVCGGTEKIEETPEVEAAAYTMCFEDRPEKADYDMNDVVLQVTRVNKTHLQIAVVACGAEDKVVIHGLTGSRFDGQEIHDIFMLEENQHFVNTEANGLHLHPMTDGITVPENLSIMDYLKNVYIKNETTNKEIKMPQAGNPPYAIIVPLEFLYPLEGKSITKVYKDFLKWAADINVSGDWYKYGDANQIFSELFREW